MPFQGVVNSAPFPESGQDVLEQAAKHREGRRVHEGRPFPVVPTTRRSSEAEVRPPPAAANGRRRKALPVAAPPTATGDGAAATRWRGAAGGSALDYNRVRADDHTVERKRKRMQEESPKPSIPDSDHLPSQETEKEREERLQRNFRDFIDSLNEAVLEEAAERARQNGSTGAS